MNDESPFGLMMIDIDHFKKVNDTYGHDVGDDLLHQLTQRITQSFPDADAYRQGGKSFVSCIVVIKLA
jgi:diguanylate cyclase (GGDEF)-like protein